MTQSSSQKKCNNVKRQLFHLQTYLDGIKYMTRLTDIFLPLFFIQMFKNTA